MLKNLTISRFLSDYEHVFHVKLWENCLLQIELERDFSCMNTHVLFPILLYTKHLARMEQSLVNVHMLLHATRIVMLPCVEAHMRLQTSALFESFFADDT